MKHYVSGGSLSEVQPTAAPSCKDHEILRDRVRADLRVYRAAVNALDKEVAKNDGNIEKAFKNARIAQDAYELASMKPDEHIASHGCG